MRCPKDSAPLFASQLPEGLEVHACADCDGAWIASEVYAAWQAQQPADADPTLDIQLPRAADIDYRPSPYDGRAGLCPECGFYLARHRIDLKSTCFFIERCPGCNGVWCDRGEWSVLQQLSLSTSLPLIFTEDWQHRVRTLDAQYREQQATIEKLGPDIAAKLFELSELLEAHPMGDFGVAYLMRRFEE